MTGRRMEMLVSMLAGGAAILLLLGAIFFVCSHNLRARVKVQAAEFTESARELDNPNRGFYYIYDFLITDEQTDYKTLIKDRYQKDEDTRLMLIQICLQDYRAGAISEAGMENIHALFDALDTVDKQLIVRFVYDWEGQNALYEPDSLDIILNHMEQLEPVLKEHSGQIFTLQGLFIGNWGEMHGTKYNTEGNLRALALKLAAVTEETTYLAVRTPAQWRMIMQSRDPAAEMTESRALNGRLGLFNDGMLGNESDYGTYGTEEAEKAGIYDKWNRKDELSFQSDLCRQVPNGGEVIVSNVYNDIDNAVKDMAVMHVTYLNRDYDKSVLEKWEASTINETGCFNGMDGYTYVERHLGYRLLIDNVDYIYLFWENRLLANITLKNVGFAPMYREPVMKLNLYSKENGQLLIKGINDTVKDLAGGNDVGAKKKVRVEINLGEIPSGEYELYFQMMDPKTGQYIELANEQEEEEYGYWIGTMEYR